MKCQCKERGNRLSPEISIQILKDNDDWLLVKIIFSYDDNSVMVSFCFPNKKLYLIKLIENFENALNVLVLSRKMKLLSQLTENLIFKNDP